MNTTELLAIVCKLRRLVERYEAGVLKILDCVGAAGRLLLHAVEEDGVFDSIDYLELRLMLRGRVGNAVIHKDARRFVQIVCWLRDHEDELPCSVPFYQETGYGPWVRGGTVDGRYIANVGAIADLIEAIANAQVEDPIASASEPAGGAGSDGDQKAGGEGGPTTTRTDLSSPADLEKTYARSESFWRVRIGRKEDGIPQYNEPNSRPKLCLRAAAEAYAKQHCIPLNA